MNGKTWNRSLVDEVVPYRMQMADDQMPTLAIAFALNQIAGELPTAQIDGATVEIDPDGGTGSKLLIILRRNRVDQNGDALSALTTSINGATYTTLKDQIDAINAVDGFTAWAMHAPHDLSTDSDDFMEMAETEVRCDGKPLECLYRDVSEGSTKYCYMRVGMPTERDSGRMRVVRLEGTSTGVTAPTLKLYADAYSGDAPTELRGFTRAAALTAYIDSDKMKADVYRGPLLLEAGGTNLTAADYKLSVMTAEW